MADRDAEQDGELALLGELFAGLWPAAAAGDPSSVNAALRVLERRSKLLGQNATSKQNTESEPVDDLTARRATRRGTTAN
jgi:hypothetical protein